MYCFKIFYTLKPSKHIKINFKNYSNMFRSHWTNIREHVVPIPKLPLITYYYVTLWFCGSRHVAAEPQCNVLIISRTIARYINENKKKYILLHFSVSLSNATGT